MTGLFSAIASINFPETVNFTDTPESAPITGGGSTHIGSTFAKLTLRSSLSLSIDARGRSARSESSPAMPAARGPLKRDRGGREDDSAGSASPQRPSPPGVNDVADSAHHVIRRTLTASALASWDDRFGPPHLPAAPLGPVGIDGAATVEDFFDGDDDEAAPRRRHGRSASDQEHAGGGLWTTQPGEGERFVYSPGVSCKGSQIGPVNTATSGASTTPTSTPAIPQPPRLVPLLASALTNGAGTTCSVTLRKTLFVPASKRNASTTGQPPPGPGTEALSPPPPVTQSNRPSPINIMQPPLVPLMSPIPTAAVSLATVPSPTGVVPYRHENEVVVSSRGGLTTTTTILLVAPPPASLMAPNGVQHGRRGGGSWAAQEDSSRISKALHVSYSDRFAVKIPNAPPSVIDAADFELQAAAATPASSRVPPPALGHWRLNAIVIELVKTDKMLKLELAQFHDGPTGGAPAAAGGGSTNAPTTTAHVGGVITARCFDPAASERFMQLRFALPTSTGSCNHNGHGNSSSGNIAVGTQLLIGLAKLREKSASDIEWQTNPHPWVIDLTKTSFVVPIRQLDPAVVDHACRAALEPFGSDAGGTAGGVVVASSRVEHGGSRGLIGGSGGQVSSSHVVEGTVLQNGANLAVGGRRRSYYPTELVPSRDVLDEWHHYGSGGRREDEEDVGRPCLPPGSDAAYRLQHNGLVPLRANGANSTGGGRRRAEEEEHHPGGPWNASSSSASPSITSSLRSGSANDGGGGRGGGLGSSHHQFTSAGHPVDRDGASRRSQPATTNGRRANSDDDDGTTARRPTSEYGTQGSESGGSGGIVSAVRAAGVTQYDIARRDAYLHVDAARDEAIAAYDLLRQQAAKTSNRSDSPQVGASNNVVAASSILGTMVMDGGVANHLEEVEGRGASSLRGFDQGGVDDDDVRTVAGKAQGGHWDIDNRAFAAARQRLWRAVLGSRKAEGPCALCGVNFADAATIESHVLRRLLRINANHAARFVVPIAVLDAVQRCVSAAHLMTADANTATNGEGGRVGAAAAGGGGFRELSTLMDLFADNRQGSPFAHQLLCATPFFIRTQGTNIRVHHRCAHLADMYQKGRRMESDVTSTSRCVLCGEAGAQVKCYHPECKKYFHVVCTLFVPDEVRFDTLDPEKPCAACRVHCESSAAMSSSLMAHLWKGAPFPAASSDDGHNGTRSRRRSVKAASRLSPHLSVDPAMISHGIAAVRSIALKYPLLSLLPKPFVAACSSSWSASSSSVQRRRSSRHHGLAEALLDAFQQSLQHAAQPQSFGSSATNGNNSAADREAALAAGPPAFTSSKRKQPVLLIDDDEEEEEESRRGVQRGDGVESKPTSAAAQHPSLSGVAPASWEATSIASQPLLTIGLEKNEANRSMLHKTTPGAEVRGWKGATLTTTTTTLEQTPSTNVSGPPATAADEEHAIIARFAKGHV